MAFNYSFKNNEANFGPPIDEQVDGGTHISFEIILKKDSQYIALRRPEAIPGHEHPPKNKKGGLLYFCHDLIRYGEEIQHFVNRVVKKQCGVSVNSFKIIDIESSLQGKDNQWAFTPYVVVELEKLPEPGVYGNEVTEVVSFNVNNVPDEFGWWKKEELKEFLDSI